MAWSILSVVPKTILAQVDRIHRLVDIMNDVFSLVNEAKLTKEIESRVRIFYARPHRTSPWNSFLHSAVYDLIHHILTGNVFSGLS